MTHARPLVLTMLFVASAGTFAAPSASAQDSAPPPTDSAKADSATPKKSRFAGLKDKARAVANNKKVQDAAKGAACTVVPGAAISAATGQGPCANAGLMGSLMSGGKAAAAASAASMASGAAANLANKGGIVGAAAGAGLGAMNGLTGLSPALAQANAMKILMGAKSNGISTSAAQAAAMQMMTQNGMSTAMSTAAITRMVKDANKASTPADAAAALQMIQAMGLMSNGGANMSTPNMSGGPAAKAAPAAAPAPAIVWTNYDFVPGERVIYHADFTDDNVGSFPSRINLVEGNLEVGELGGRRVLRASTPSKITIPLPEVLPQRFTIEIDVVNRPLITGTDFQLRGSVGRMDDKSTSIIHWGSDGAGLLGGGGGEVKIVNNEVNRARYTGKPAQIRIIGDGKYVKVYLDEKRVANVPNANFQRSNVLHLAIDARSDENPAYVSRIRVSESRKIYDDIAANGQVATHGIIFDWNSDRIRPESAPTLKMIADMLTEHPELRIRIEGHTDNVGAKEANRTLSDKRAAAVKAAIIKDYKIDAKRLESKGFGDAKGIGDNATAVGRANNRRVQLVKI